MKRITLLIAAVLLSVFTMATACKTTPPSDAAKLVEEKVREKTGQIDLYVMAIGINGYSNNVFPNLKYAANDAQNICGVFKAQEGIFFRNVNTLLIADDGGISPTTDNIISNMEFFKDVRPNDTVILFVASHRIIIDDTFYIMSSDSKYNNDDGFILESFVNFNDILKALDMPAYKIIILDTNAPEIAKGGDITVLRACKEDEKAIETNRYDGGLLTTSILEAFEKAETELGVIKLSALSDYVVKRVGEMSENKQTPVFSAASGANELIMGFRLNLSDLGINIPSSN